MDISSMLIGKSDQLDNVDLISGPRDFTITDVKRRDGEQPLDISLAEYDRVWRPGLTMRRLLAAIWGRDASVYVGRRVRLFRDPEITFGKDKTGGTRVSHASHLERTVTVSLPASKGKFKAHTVEPLPDTADAADTIRESRFTEPTVEDIAACTNLDALRAWWKVSGSANRALIELRTKELNATDHADEARQILQYGTAFTGVEGGE